MNRKIGRIRKGDIIKLRWKDAVEGEILPNLQETPHSRLSKFLTSDVSTIGRFLRVIGGYLVMTDVLHEEADGELLFEKQGSGKWISVPLSSVKEIGPADDILDAISAKTRRRRTLVRHLRFIPRSRRLANGRMSRMLYVA